MRSLFLFLVLLNVLYGLWQLQDRKADISLYESADQALEVLPMQQQAVSHPAVVPGSPEQGATTRLCVSMGVFSSRSEAQQLQQRLLALAIQSSVISRAGVDAEDYWLIMPAAGGQSGARQRLSQLQAEGLDSFIITQGPLADSISLGVFAREDYALARQAQLQALGHDLKIERQAKPASEFLVQVSSEARRLVDQSLLARLRESFPQLQHQFLPCKAVAD